MLIHNITPKPAPPEQRELGSHWAPFRQLRNARWVLQAHALEVDPGVDANLLQAPNGDYLVPLVMESSGGSPSATLLEVKARVQDADAIKAAFLLSPERTGDPQSFVYEEQRSACHPPFRN